MSVTVHVSVLSEVLSGSIVSSGNLLCFCRLSWVLSSVVVGMSDCRSRGRGSNPHGCLRLAYGTALLLLPLWPQSLGPQLVTTGGTLGQPNAHGCQSV